MRKLLALAAVAFAAAPVHAWGGSGHQYVARLAVASLPTGPLKGLLAQNVDWLATASSHPDRWRNRPDAAENGRHFLDTERFGFGTDIDRVPHDYEGAVKLRGYDNLRADGINPWTVQRVYGLLVRALRERRWDDALVQSAYLSHYVGDAHVPFHASENYDGQLSTPPQRGIHSRFEDRLLEKTIKFTDLKPGVPTPMNAPAADTFAVLKSSLAEVPTILAADRAASQAAGNVDSDAYWKAFATVARPIAVARLELGGRDLAGMLLAAWQDAGRPKTPAEFIARDATLPYAPPFVPRGEAPKPAMPEVSAEAKAAARSRAEVIQIYSEALQKTVPVTILRPARYDAETRRYPVLYLLHGASGDHADWNGKSGVAAYTTEIPMIVVMPDAQGDSFWIDTPGGGKVQRFLLKELVPAIDDRFRTIARREGRAIAGLSMGGYGALRTALDAPKTFCAAASLSGAVFWGEGSVEGPLRGFVDKLYPKDAAKAYGTGAIFSRVLKQARRGNYRGPALYFDCGKEDFLIASNRDLERRLMTAGIPYEFAEFNGAHTWAYWDEHIRDVLNFVQRHVRAAE